MRKVALFYNPMCAGGGGTEEDRRLRQIANVRGILERTGITVSTASTQGSSVTGRQVRGALDDGCDTILACGGDGTVHDAAQELVGTEARLGIIPLGTANVLAHDLKIPRNAIAAAQALLKAEPRRIAVGRLEYCDLAGQSASRFFLVTAGVGADAHLFYKLDPFAKRRFGVASYYAKAVHTWLTYNVPEFSASIDAEHAKPGVTQLLAVRIRNFGGVLRELAPGASLERNDLRLVLFRTRSRLRYLACILRGIFGARWQIGGIEVLNAAAVDCTTSNPANSRAPRIFVEADGELLGTLPVRISIVPDALTLLVP